MKNSSELRHSQKCPINILIINLHSSRNAGDAALAMTAIQTLKANFPGSRITLSMNDPSSHPGEEPKVGSFMRWSQSTSGEGVVKWNWNAMIRLIGSSLLTAWIFRLFKKPVYFWVSNEQKVFLQAYLDADLVTSAPGNFLYSSGKWGITIAIIVYSMAFALLLKKPLYILPQSIGPLRRGWEKKLVRWVLMRTRMILVREPVSMQQLEKIGVSHPRCYLIPDLAFSFSGAPLDVTRDWLKGYGVDVNHDRPLLGITMINWAAQNFNFSQQEQYETSIYETALNFVNKLGGKVIFFPQVYGATEAADDRVPARRVVERLREITDRAILIETPTEPEMLKTAYGLMDQFIGTRMHSNIFALTGGVPVLAIAYRHKTKGLMQMVGLEDWVIDIDQVNKDSLNDISTRLWKARETVREKIHMRIPDLADQSSKTGALIATDFFAQYQWK